MTGTEAPTKVLHYRGNREDFDPDSFIGCNSRFFRPVSAAYNPETDQTAIEYVQVQMGQEMNERYGQKRDDKLRIVENLGSQW